MHANLHISTIRRSSGRTAPAASAYRSGSAVKESKPRSLVACAAYRASAKLADEKYEKTHDYTHKENVLHSEIVAPDGAPAWMTDREALWNRVEAGEKRKDAQLAKEIILTLPRNLDFNQQREAVREFVKENLTSRGLVADFAIHSPEASDGERNPHAHVMFTLRPVEGDGFGEKLTGYHKDPKARDSLGLDGRETLNQMRQSYERILNEASEQADTQIRFDLRNLQERGIDRQPQPKIGPKVTYLEKRGWETEWGKEVRQSQHRNQAKQAQQTHNSYNRATYLAGRAFDVVRDDIAHKYYEVMYGPEAAYGEYDQPKDHTGHELER